LGGPAYYIQRGLGKKMALVAIVNILAVFALRKPIIAALRNYDEARKTTDEPIFRAKDIGLTNTDCWK